MPRTVSEVTHLNDIFVIILIGSVTMSVIDNPGITRPWNTWLFSIFPNGI